VDECKASDKPLPSTVTRLRSASGRSRSFMMRRPCSSGCSATRTVARPLSPATRVGTSHISLKSKDSSAIDDSRSSMVHDTNLTPGSECNPTRHHRHVRLEPPLHALQVQAVGLSLTPGGWQIGGHGHHTGCHRLNRVLTHNNNVVKSAPALLGGPGRRPRSRAASPPPPRRPRRRRCRCYWWGHP
jgi:hypothetical protein